jgi:hypothetical protein
MAHLSTLRTIAFIFTIKKLLLPANKAICMQLTFVATKVAVY